MTLVIELGAPIALLGARARGVGPPAWGFHVGVVLLMKIVFPYPLLGVAYLPLLRVERAGHWLIGWRRRRAGMPGSDGGCTAVRTTVLAALKTTVVVMLLSVS